MWFFIRFCLFITLFGVSLTASAQNDNNPYELGDTVIVKDLLRQAEELYEYDNKLLEGGEIIENCILFSQCLYYKYSNYKSVSLLNSKAYSCHYKYFYNDTNYICSENKRLIFYNEIKEKFGFYSRELISFNDYEIGVNIQKRNFNKAIILARENANIRRKIYNICNEEYSGYYTLGNIFQNINTDSAIFYFKKSLEWTQTFFDSTHENNMHIYNRLGINFYNKSHFDSSVFYFKKALQVSKLNGNKDIINLQWLYHNYLNLAHKGFDLAYNTDSIFHEYVNVINKLPEDKIIFSVVASVYLGKGDNSMRLDLIKEAIKYYYMSQKTILKAKRTSGLFGFSLDAISYLAYERISFAYEALNYNNLSKNTYEMALEILIEESKSSEVYYFATNGFNLLEFGKKYYLDTKLSHYKKYYTLANGYMNTFFSDSSDTRFIASHLKYTTSNLSNIHLLNIQDQYLRYMKKFISIFNLINANNVHIRQMQGIIDFIRMRRFNNILKPFQIYNKITDFPDITKNNIIKSKLYLDLSHLYKIHTNIDTAIFCVQNSIKYLLDDTTIRDLVYNPNVTKIKSSKYTNLTSILLQKAQLLYALPATDPRRQYADSSLTLAEQVADLALAKLKNSYDRIDFLATLRKIIETRLHAELDKGQPHSAYEAIERNRARMLFLHYAEQKANQLNQIPPADRFALDSLTTLISDTDIKLSLLRAKSKPTPEEETMLQSFTRRKIACEEMRLDILQKIESNIPEYVEGLKEKPTFDVEKFRQTFFTRPENTNKAVLEYFQTEDSLYLFCLTGSGLKMKSYAVSDSLMNTLADAFTATMADSFPKFLRLRQPKKSADTFKQYVKQGTDLYHRLVAPFTAEIKGKDLIIVPDGAIWKIPMEALLAIRSDKERDSLIQLYESLEENAYKFLPYLVQDHSVERRLSLTFETDKPEQKVDYKYDLVAFAPVFEDKGKKTGGVSPSSVARSFLNGIRFHASRSFAVLSDASGESMTITPLPESKNEVHKIAGLIAKSSKNPLSVKVFLQNEATESQFKTLQNQPIKYLHIATHGFANINQPNLSGLIFTPEKTLKEDGVLYAGEIQSMKYPSYLVTLSACETGRGKVISGEGILGLMYGFMQSGTENVVSSYWTVNDRATSQMMSDLYSRLQTGQLPTHALRSSQKQMITGGYASPYFWASFSTYKLKQYLSN